MNKEFQTQSIFDQKIIRKSSVPLMNLSMMKIDDKQEDEEE